jgi:hypothetical protein
VVLHAGCIQSRTRRARTRVALLLAIAIILPLLYRPNLGRAQEAGRIYPQTGYTLAPQFVSYFDSHGGVPILGYPITEATQENGYLVQWTERQRLEWHPENAGTDYEVMLGLLGRELTSGLNGPHFQASNELGADQADPPASAPSDQHYFPQTGQYVSDLFYNYWQQNGGVPVFGYPISQSYSDDGLQTQWFERARFEVHPENPPATRVLLGQLGKEELQVDGMPYYTLQVNGTPAPDTSLQIGLAQGGESSDPSFFGNIQQPVQALGPGVVRLDNIFDYYNVVQRRSDGTLAYDWSRLDQVLSSIRSMGKEPLLCLSYMPEALSADGSSHVLPPANYADWAALVTATVRHVNIDMGFGVRYWEVWNEPNIWSFWQAPYTDYLKLYDVTVQAALAADPTVKIGGPSVSYFSPDHIRDFLTHESALGSNGRVDFISWHSYGNSPDEVAANIRDMRKMLEGFPQFNPQIFITEFNILQGGAGDTSANGYTDTVEGAIAFLSSIEGMQRERLDRALLFELKDGPGSKSYWGRWGILTYDGLPKPIYYALKAYQNRPPGMLPVTVRSGPTDGTLGLMAYGSPAKSTILLWYTGFVDARVKVSLPDNFSDTYYDVALFDHDTNNPARSGDAPLQMQLAQNAGDLVFDLKPQSLVILTSR